MPVILALDLGKVRVGMALSDETQRIASAFKTVPFQGREQLLGEVEVVVSDYGVGRIVVGLPLNLKGEEDIAAERVRKHVEWFQSRSDKEWVFWDERFTTREAEKILIQANVSRKKRKEVIDQLAAQRILQSYLDANAKEA